MRHGVLAAPRCRPRMAIFADPVQATRDLTSSLAASTEVRATIAVATSLLLSAGAVASWRAGERFAERTRRSLTGSDAAILLCCVVVDLVGDGSLLPGLLPFDDKVWAPVSALLVRALLGSTALAAADFAKELLPAADVLPLATLGWLLRYADPESVVARALGLDAWSDWRREQDER